MNLGSEVLIILISFPAKPSDGLALSVPLITSSVLCLVTEPIDNREAVKAAIYNPPTAEDVHDYRMALPGEQAKEQKVKEPPDFVGL